MAGLFLSLTGCAGKNESTEQSLSSSSAPIQVSSTSQSSSETTSSSMEVKADGPAWETGTLLRAVEDKDMALVEKVIQNTKNLDEVNDKQETPLMIAVHNNQIDIAKLLIDAGADINKQDSIKDTPYLYAGAEGRTEILKYMLEHAEPNNKIYNRYGGNAIIPAAEKGHLENVKLLIADGREDINHQNNFNYTALIEAVALSDGSKTQQDIVQALVDAGADTKLKDNNGQTAEDYARAKGYQNMLKIIEKK